MAINFGMLDTSIPAQIGAIPGNALANYVKTKQGLEDRDMARQHAETQNALSQLQLTQGQRGLAEEEAYKNALAGVQGGDFQGAMPKLIQASPSRAIALQKTLSENQKTDLETKLKRFDVIDRAAGQFAANPTRQTGVWVLSQLAANGTPPEVIQQMSQKLNAAKDEDLPGMANAFLSATREGMKAHVESMFPKAAQPTDVTRLMEERRRAAAAGDAASVATLDQAIRKATTHAPVQAPSLTILPGAGGQQFFVDPRNPTKPAVPVLGPSGEPIVKPMAATDIDKALKPLRDDLDPQGFRAGQMKANQMVLDRADRLKALITDSGGQLRNLDSRQTEELAIGLNALLSGSNVGAQSQVAALVPHTAVGSASKLYEWLANNPTGTNQLEFVKRMAETVDREREVAVKKIRAAQAARLPAHAGLFRAHPEEAKALLESYGLDPARLNDRLQYSEAGPSVPAAAPMTTMPPPAGNEGRIIRASTGVRYRSDGTSWVKVQ